MASKRPIIPPLSRTQSQIRRDEQWDDRILHHVDSLGTGRFVTRNSQTETDDEKDEKADEPDDHQEPRESIELDLEEGSPPVVEKTKSVKDPYIVSWDGPNDPSNPKNWSFKRKWAATVTVSLFTFISPVVSSLVAPASTAISSELKITSEIESQLVLSIFVLAYAIGPLLLGPLSELYGRAPVLQLANLFFLAWNIGCGFAQTKGQLIAFRFMAGLGGSAPLAIGGGVLGDTWPPEERGKSIAIYSLAPLLGPAVGPIAGGFIAENTTWRWCFWSTSIADVLVQILGILFLQETFAPVLLAKKAKKLRKETGDEKYRTEWETPDRTIGKVISTALVRPFKLLGTQPILQALTLFMAYLYGLMYLVLSTFPMVWNGVYNESIGIGGLNYISLGAGFFIGTQINTVFNDRIYRSLKRRNNNTGRPEFRVPLMNIGAAMVPAGLFIYGWTAENAVHWIAPNIGAAIFAAGMIVAYQCIQTYLVDVYTRYAASALAAAASLRSLAGFGFPLFAPYMYQALGLGWGNSLLGFIGVAIGIPAPILLWRFGEALRAKNTFATG